MAETWKKLAFYDEVATNFIGLTDTPADYTGAGDKYVKVNAGGTALEWGATLATIQDHTPKAHLLGAHTTDTLANLNAIVTDATLDDSGDPRDPNAHKASHQTTGADELDLTGMKADSIAEKTADAGVTVDTCLIKDGKAADSNLLEGSNKAAVQDHTPKAHKASHQDGGADELTLNALGEPVAAVPFAGQQATDLVAHSVANAAARPTPVVAKICHQQDDSHLYICTVAV